MTIYRIRLQVSKFTIFNRKQIKIENKYLYLGTPIKNLALGFKATQYSIYKAKLASGSVLSILARSKADSWEAKIKRFGSMVESTLFYVIQIWGLR